jgi:hypothetical protein
VKQLFLTLFLLFISLPIFGQSASYALKGTVVSNNNESVNDGVIVLATADGSQVIKSTVITDGAFSFEPIIAGNYILQITCLGYEGLNQPVDVDKNISLKLILRDSTTVLNEVTIDSRKKTFTNANGNLKVDVANSIFRATTNPLDLLSKLPTIQVSADKETLTIIGRGQPLIYIDNQRVSMNDLNALSVEDIKTIEIIKNPSSKYEAEGRAVILITRKLSKKDGFEVVGSETASVKRGYNNFAGINSSFKKGKTEFKANFNYNQLYHWEAQANNLNITNAGIATNYHILSVSKRPQYIFGAGMFHQLNDDDYISININSKLQGDDDHNRTHSYILQDDSENYITTLTQNDNHRNFVNGFANYNKKIKSFDAKLFTGLQFSNFNQASYSTIENNYNETNFITAQNRDQKFIVNAFSGRADIEKTFNNDMKWEAGALYLSATAKTNFKVNDYQTETTNKSIYDFHEKNMMGYVQVSGKLKKLSYSGGLRSETTDIEGKYDVLTTPTINKTYTNLFPKAQLEYEIDSTMTLNFNYAKSIARPNYSSTSQVTVYGSPILVFSNNLNLNPAITNEIFTTLQYKGKSIMLRYYNTKNPTYFAFSYNATDALVNFSTINYAKESGFNVDVTMPFEYKLWSTNNVLSFAMNKIQDNAAVLNETEPYLYYSTNNTFKLPKNYAVMLSAWGVTKRKEGAITRNALFTADAALSKTLFNVLDCTLSYNNFLGNLKFDENYTINTIASQGRYFSDIREIALSIKYRFGNLKNSIYKEKNVNESEGRIR